MCVTVCVCVFVGVRVFHTCMYVHKHLHIYTCMYIAVSALIIVQILCACQLPTKRNGLYWNNAYHLDEAPQQPTHMLPYVHHIYIQCMAHLKLPISKNATKNEIIDDITGKFFQC